MKKLSEEKLCKMENYIVDYIRENGGISPSFGEIMQYMEMNNSVGYRYLLALRDRGVIEYEGRDTLRIKNQDLYKAHTLPVPIYGSIACGEPFDSRQEPSGYLPIAEEWIDGECFLLHTMGDSMVDIGIEEGDLVLVKRTSEARDGQVIAVLTEDGTTLKRFKKDKNGIPYLLAENSDYPPERRELRPENIIVQGIALKIIKDVRHESFRGV